MKTSTYNLVIVLFTALGSYTYGFNSSMIASATGLSSFWDYFNLTKTGPRAEWSTQMIGGMEIHCLRFFQFAWRLISSSNEQSFSSGRFNRVFVGRLAGGSYRSKAHNANYMRHLHCGINPDHCECKSRYVLSWKSSSGRRRWYD